MVAVPSLSVDTWLLSVSVRGEEGRYYLLLASHPPHQPHHSAHLLYTDMETRCRQSSYLFAVLVAACMEESARYYDPVPPLTLHCTVHRHELYLLVHLTVSTVYINRFIVSFSEMGSPQDRCIKCEI